MDLFRKKYKNYENFNNMFRKIKKYIFNKTFEYNIDKEKQFINLSKISLNGGDPNIEEIIKKYSDIINFQIDKISNDEIEVMVVNINSQITCAILIIDNKSKIATIQDLKSDFSCLKKSSKKIIKTIIKILIKICKKMEMKTLMLTDSAEHNCNGLQASFKLNIANTLTSGKPYYYKYGFRYQLEENDKIVRRNKDIINSSRTNYINLKDLTGMIQYVLQKKGKSRDYINDKIKFITKIYNKMIDEPISKFMNYIKYKDCELFSYLYIDFAVILNLDFLATNRLMFINLV